MIYANRGRPSAQAFREAGTGGPHDRVSVSSVDFYCIILDSQQCSYLYCRRNILRTLKLVRL
jgi:hypothetical protein